MHKVLAKTIFLMAVSLLGISAQASQIRTIAMARELAPGTDAYFSNFDLSDWEENYVFSNAPSINDNGAVVFQAKLSGGGVTNSNDVGIWTDQGKGLTYILREGDHLPDTRFPVSGIINWSPSINNVGQVAFMGGTGMGSGGAIWMWDSGVIAPVLRWGIGEAGFDATLSTDSAPLLDDYGTVAFRGYNRVKPYITTFGIYSNRTGIIQSFAVTDDMVPESDHTFTYISSPSGNSNGDIAFLSHASADDVFRLEDYGVWLVKADKLHSVAMTGESAPGTDGTFGHYPSGAFNSSPGLSDSGKLVFVAKLEGQGIDLENDSGLWAGTLGSVKLIAQEGDTAPGADARFAEFESKNSPKINDSERITFLASVRGGSVTDENDQGIWTTLDGSLKLVAREGSTAPETDATFDYLGFPELVNTGQTVFIGRLKGRNVNEENDDGIWATNSAGDLVLIAREGDIIDVNDGPITDERTIQRLGYSPRTGVNQHGLISFMATFTDGTSGIFISNKVAIPEPNTGLLLLFSIVLHLGRCRKRF